MSLLLYNLSMSKKDEIIEKAAMLFSEKGYYGVGLKELLDSCGVPKGSFYYYFPNGKIDLLNQVMEYCYEKMEYGIRTRYFTHDSLLEDFESMADGLGYRLTEKDHFVSLTMSMIGIESVYLDESINQKCQEIYSKWQKLYIERFLLKGYETEEAIEKAQAIFGMIHGALISSWIKRNNDDLQYVKKTLKYIIQ